MQRSAESQQE
uniref:Uncharacterized protein n=1 Tax=Anguilla anguilla TaxID=7936 RepID=A0A0E9Q871_ANGAN